MIILLLFSSSFKKVVTFHSKIFIVAAKEDATNAAYLSTGLQLHTDLPYYEYKPSVRMMIYLKTIPTQKFI